MHDGTCPSCRGTEVYAARNGLDLGDSIRVGIRPHLEPGFRGAVALHRSESVWTYTCVSCGLTEIRIHDPATIDFIRQRWVRVAPPT